MKIFSKIFKRSTSPLESQIKGWSDVECITNFMKFFPRVGVSTEFIQNKYGFITHQTLNIQCGNNLVQAHPIELDWPLEPVAFPEEHEGKLN